MAKAANGDTVRQSQFSRQMKDLEEHFGRKLTERRGRNVVLTKEGAEFAALARQILGALEDFHVTGSTSSVEISVGAGESFYRGVLLPRLAQITDRLPGVVLSLKNLRGIEIVEGLLDGRLDLGVVDENELSNDLQYERLGKISYRLVAQQKSINPRGAKLMTWKSMISLPFVGMEGTNRVISAVEKMALEMGSKITFSVKCSSWLGVADVLATQGGVGVLPSIIQIPDGCVAINAPGLNVFDRSIVLAWDARRGTIRHQSIKCQRVLRDVLKL